MSRELDLLNTILLDDNVVSKFYEAYNNNDKFKKWLLGIIPEIEDCNKQQQNNPWHLYNVLGHILYSVKYMNEITKTMSDDKRKMLAYVMFLHDVGKPACCVQKEKNGVVRDTFHGHNVVSKQVASRVLDKFGFDDIQIPTMLKLIEMHDVFMDVVLDAPKKDGQTRLTDKYVINLLEELNKYGNGIELMYDLINIRRADNSAQNPELTGESFQVADKIEGILDNYVSMQGKN